jgi:hypothetical protein
VSNKHRAPTRKATIHVSAYDEIGRTLVAGLEVLHMCDREAAIKAVFSLLPIESDIDELIEDLEAVGAIAFARDLFERRHATSKHAKRKRSR